MLNGIGLGLRSGGGGEHDDPLVDDDAYTLKKTDAKALTRLHWEDMLHMPEGDGMVIYFRKNADLSIFSDYPREAAKKQPRVKESTKLKNEVKLNGHDFYVTKAKILEAPYHLEAQTGAMALSQLQNHFKRGAHVKLEFYGTGATMPFEWRQVVDFGQDVYFFGSPVDGVRD